VFRTVSVRAAEAFRAARDSGILARYADQGVLIQSSSVDAVDVGLRDPGVAHVVEHPRIPFISYPYEWSFSLLKAAALRHLDLQLSLLGDNFALSDATAYNIQFLGSRALFIDLLSIRPYREGEYWLAHNQFCEQFLNPLLLRSLFGIPHNDWYRGRLEGIPSAAIEKILPIHRKFSLRMLGHVVGPARLQRDSERRRTSKVVRGSLPRFAYQSLLQQLRKWIAALKPLSGDTQWKDYENFHSYSGDEDAAKRELVARFVSDVRPAMIWDLGCNTGIHCEIAARSGAITVVGFDFDHGALDKAFARSENENLNFLPLFLDGANPSPSQGWAQKERLGLTDRAPADCLLALAFIHHLCIARNVPLPEAVDWLIGLAPKGLIEFVQKDDPTVKEMLALREDVFDGYNEQNFVSAVEARARIVKQRRNPDNGRLLVIYERN
jgi:ribosomal protein L11 methylase PrmA